MPKGDEVGVIETSLPGFGIGVHDHSSDPEGSILDLYARGSCYQRRSAGTVPLERWYGMPRTAANFGTASMVANRLYGFPFIVPKKITLDRIGIKVTSTVAAFFRLGIYNDNGNAFPGALALDSGPLPCTTGLQIKIINLDIFPPLVWLSLLSGSTPAMSADAASVSLNILGSGPTLDNSPIGIYHAFAYAALPDPFPTAAPALLLGSATERWNILVRLSVN
jgi:hypothetical protein